MSEMSKENNFFFVYAPVRSPKLLLELLCVLAFRKVYILPFFRGRNVEMLKTHRGATGVAAWCVGCRNVVRQAAHRSAFSASCCNEKVACFLCCPTNVS